MTKTFGYVLNAMRISYNVNLKYPITIYSFSYKVIEYFEPHYKNI